MSVNHLGPASEPLSPRAARAHARVRSVDTRTSLANHLDAGARHHGWDVFRAAVLTVFLIGTLLPQSTSIQYTSIAAVLAFPFIAAEIIRLLPRVHTVALFTVPVFLLLSIPGIVHPPSGEYGQEKFHNLMTLTMMSALAATLVRNPRALSTFALVWFVAGCVIAVSTVFGDIRGGRAVGLDDANPIWLARALGSSLVTGLWLCMQHRLRAGIFVPAATLIGTGLVLTGSRGPLSATLVASFLILVGQRQNRTTRLTTATVLLGSAAAIVVLTPITSGTRFDGLLTDPTVGLNQSGRSRLLELTYPVIAAHPEGVGYGNWQAASGAAVFNYPHNLWLELTAEAGWLVSAAFILTAASVLARLFVAAQTSAHSTLVLAILAFEMACVSVSGDLNARSFFSFLALGWVSASWHADNTVDNTMHSGRQQNES